MPPTFHDKKYPHPDLVKVQRGFTENSMHAEYVEFTTYNSRVRFVAQIANGGWTYIYEVYPGKKGAVNTIGEALSIPQDAADKAFELALAVAQRQ